MGISDSIKRLGELAIEVRDNTIKSELLQRILEVQNDNATLQEKLVALRDENAALKDEIAAAQRKADVRSKLTFDKVTSLYMLKDELGERPICPACFESDQVTIPLPQPTSNWAAYCPKCKARYLVSSR